jgi:hypothetical protein
MLFAFVCFAAFATLAFVVTGLLTARRLAGDWRKAAPAYVAEALARRNRALLIGFALLLCLTGLIEALVADFSFSLQGLQEDAFGRGLPAWALAPVGAGTISWLFYLSVLAGIGCGIIMGTLWSLRRHREFIGLSVRNIA